MRRERPRVQSGVDRIHFMTLKQSWRNCRRRVRARRHCTPPSQTVSVWPTCGTVECEAAKNTLAISPYYTVLLFRSEKRPASLSTFAGSCHRWSTPPLWPRTGVRYEGMRDSWSRFTCCSPSEQETTVCITYILFCFFFFFFFTLCISRTLRHREPHRPRIPWV